jgi:hypothetical protein
MESATSYLINVGDEEAKEQAGGGKERIAGVVVVELMDVGKTRV